MKKILISFILVFVIISSISANFVLAVNTNEVHVNLNDDSITVNGQEISETVGDSIYVTKNIETHEEVSEEYKNLENKVITITKSGTYSFSGEIENAQIAVDVSDSEEIKIIFNNVTITNKTAPAIIVYNAKDEQKAGEAGITIELAQGSENRITGSHIPEGASYKINGEEKEYNEKYDATISSNVSINFDGTGKLIVDSDNEGIETKMHLTIENGEFEINSADDSINASEDEKSVITINGGKILANIKDSAEEGDGIDSNGYIYVNDGEVYAFASEKSEDSGLDSDMGIYINGGIVVGTGNMSDEISNDSTQTFMQLEFASSIKKDDIVAILNEYDETIMAYKANKSYKVLTISSEKMQEGKYSVYKGGEVNGVSINGLYTEVLSYKKGIIQQYGGMQMGRGFGNGGFVPDREIPNGENFIMPEGEIPEKPNGEIEEDMKIPNGVSSNQERREKPTGDFNEIREIPEGEIPQKPEGEMGEIPNGVLPQNGEFMRGEKNGNGEFNTEASTEFVVTKTNHKFSNIMDKTTEVSGKNIVVYIIIALSIILVIVVIIAIILKKRKSKK